MVLGCSRGACAAYPGDSSWPRDKHILSAVVIEIARLGDIGKLPVPRIAEHGKGLVIQGHKITMSGLPSFRIAGGRSHSRDELPVFGERHAGAKRGLFEFAAALVMEEGIVDLVIRAILAMRCNGQSGTQCDQTRDRRHIRINRPIAPATVPLAIRT
jgi:hypothetical protein